MPRRIRPACLEKRQAILEGLSGLQEEMEEVLDEERAQAEAITESEERLFRDEQEDIRKAHPMSRYTSFASWHRALVRAGYIVGSEATLRELWQANGGDQGGSDDWGSSYVVTLPPDDDVDTTLDQFGAVDHVSASINEYNEHQAHRLYGLAFSQGCDICCTEAGCDQSSPDDKPTEADTERQLQQEFFGDFIRS